MKAEPFPELPEAFGPIPESIELRDLFAMAALVCPKAMDGYETPAMMAFKCYLMADAMLEARKRRP